MFAFDGYIKEYPALSVDNLSVTRSHVKAFFLSHVRKGTCTVVFSLFYER